MTPPPGTRSASTLGRVDYDDAFVVDVCEPSARSAEQWMRMILEGASTAVRLQLMSGWSALGLRVGLSSADRSVLGWQIRRADSDFVLLGVESRIGMPGELFLRRETDRLLFATFVRHDNALVRALWARVVPTHVRMVQELLARVGSDVRS
ncbi:MAG: hypothetical protein K2X52_17145 [Mycobacteriaceae bacterium]|nr:hypothetical protein [Mycobacteriaceae bacterium]